MSGATLAETAYARLRDDIVAGRIAAETVLSERALTETLGLSRTPLRAAISRLESEGMVDRLSNGVVLVRSVTVEQLLQIVQLRQTLEAARRGPRRRFRRDRRAARDPVPDAGDRRRRPRRIRRFLGGGRRLSPRHCPRGPAGAAAGDP